jgi:hypothetical protein
MRIDRATLLAHLNHFVMDDSGVIVGGPGVGKSYLLGELGERLDAQGTPYLFFDDRYAWRGDRGGSTS